MAHTKKRSSRKSTSKEESSGKFATLHELLILKLQSLYDTEQQLVKVLPKLADAATNKELSAAFKEHLIETRGHVRRLEQAFRHLGVKPKSEKAEAIRGIAEDGSWVMKHVKDNAARDAAIIGAAQYAEHYEIAGYGTAAEWARLMGHDEVESLLSQTLQEEEAANEKLQALAEGGINDEANGMEKEEGLLSNIM